jgi:hypothetical protein
MQEFHLEKVRAEYAVTLPVAQYADLAARENIWLIDYQPHHHLTVRLARLPGVMMIPNDGKRPMIRVAIDDACDTDETHEHIRQIIREAVCVPA